MTIVQNPACRPPVQKRHETKFADNVIYWKFAVIFFFVVKSIVRKISNMKIKDLHHFHLFNEETISDVHYIIIVAKEMKLECHSATEILLHAYLFVLGN